MNKEKVMNILSILFVIFVFFYTVYMVYQDGFHNISQIMASMDYTWILVGLAATVFYWWLEGLCFYYITKKMYPNEKFRSCFRLAIIGRLFNNITPMSAGDQPMQLMVMKSEGKTISNGASILLTRFIVYQLVLVAYTIIIMIAQYTKFAELIDQYMIFAIIGFIANIIVVMFLIMLAINKNIVMKMGRGLVKLLYKIRIVKDKEKMITKVEETVTEFQHQFEMMKKEKMMIFKVALATAIEITVLYAINYVVYRALGFNESSFLTIISAQAVLAMVTVYMPTPGASLAAEGGFAIIYSTFFPSNVMAMAVLLWRFFTFYLPIIVGTVVFFMRPKKELSLKEEDEELTVEN